MVEKEIISEVKKKKIFESLPNSLVEKALILNKNSVKETRAFLRKYFGVFLTNKVVKGLDEKVLESHISSKKRNYELLYSKIHEIAGEGLKCIIDLGCGANGFSYPFVLREFGNISYTGVEAVGQITKNTNIFLEKNKFSEATVQTGDLFDLEKVKKIILNSNSKKIILLLQVIDALEKVERNFSKKLLLEIKSCLKDCDILLISNPLRSISGKREFYSNRDWLKNFLEENFEVAGIYEMFEEEFIFLRKK